VCSQDLGITTSIEKTKKNKLPKYINFPTLLLETSKYVLPPELAVKFEHPPKTPIKITYTH
jgi:hypothetical protein